MSQDQDRSPTRAVEAIGQIHLEGNIIPHSFFQRPEFRGDNGKPNLLDIILYAEILYWYRPTVHRDELTGRITKVTRKFQADMLQRSYQDLADYFGVSKRQVQMAMDRLVDSGLIRRDFRTVRLPNKPPLANVMFLEPVVEALVALNTPYAPGKECWAWCAEPSRPNLPKEAEGGITKDCDTVSQNFAIPSHKDLRYPPTKFCDTYTETSTEISTQTSTESGGEREGEIGEAQFEREAPPTPAVEDAPPVQSTTTKKSGSYSEARIRKPNGGQALPPDGGAASAARQGDLSLSEQQTRSRTTQNKNATDKKNVPGGGAAAPAPALVPLTAREVLVPALGGPKKLDSFIEERPPSGVNRQKWLALDPERVQEIIAKAREEAKGGNPWTKIIMGLDQEIGAKVQGGSKPELVVNPASFAPAQPMPKSEEPEMPLLGSQWHHRQDESKVISVAEVNGFEVKLSTGETINQLQLRKDYARLGA